MQSIIQAMASRDPMAQMKTIRDTAAGAAAGVAGAPADAYKLLSDAMKYQNNPTMAMTDMMQGNLMDYQNTPMTSDNLGAAMGADIHSPAFMAGSIGVPDMGDIAGLASGAAALIGRKIGGDDVVDFFKKAYTPDTDTLDPTELALQDKFHDELLGDIEGSLQRYAELPQTQGGKIIAADDMRELSAEYVADRSMSGAVHEPVSALSKVAWNRAVTAEGDKPVMLLSGGTGAGKTSGLKQFDLEEYGTVFDSNLQNFDKASAKIEDALAGGKDVEIVHVYRDPVEAFSGAGGSALTRAMKDGGNGRTVPLWAHTRTHEGSNKTVKQIAEKYADDPRVAVTVVDNTRGRGGAVIADPSIIPDEWDTAAMEKVLSDELEKAFTEGRINEKVYRGTKGRNN